MQQWETLIGLLEADIFSIRSALARAAAAAGGCGEYSRYWRWADPASALESAGGVPLLECGEDETIVDAALACRSGGGAFHRRQPYPASREAPFQESTSREAGRRSGEDAHPSWADEAADDDEDDAPKNLFAQDCKYA